MGRIVALAMSALVIGVGVAGNAAEPEGGFAERFAKPIERVHGKAAWEGHEAVRFDFTLKGGDGETRLAGEFVFETGRERVRMTLADGSVAVWDGGDAWVKPADTPFAEGKPRFHLRTWTYFLAAPFKLRDPGSSLRAFDGPALGEREMPTAKLTFGEGVGDAPDDWYVVYRARETDRLAGMAYIVTYGGKDPEKAAENSHAVVFDGYETIEGVTLSTDWTFYHWSTEAGVYGEPLMTAEVSNVGFVEPEAGMFAPPEGAERVLLPGE